MLFKDTLCNSFLVGSTKLTARNCAFCLLFQPFIVAQALNVARNLPMSPRHYTFQAQQQVLLKMFFFATCLQYLIHITKSLILSNHLFNIDYYFF